MASKDGKNKIQPVNESKAKVTAMFVQVEGDAATIQEALRSFTIAIDRVTPPVVQRTLTPRNVQTLLSAETTHDGGEAENVLPENPDTIEAEATEVEVEKEKKPRKTPKMPKLMNDLDYGSAVSLEDFCQEKAAKTLSEKYLTIAAWFKHHRQTEEITVDHVFTCFGVLGWKDRPDDMGQVFRNIKRVKQWFDNGSKSGFWKLTITGLNHSDNKMGKNSSGE
jgi:hypothetical protein